MMFRSILFVALFGISIFNSLQAQSFIEALRYSSNYQIGTARNIAVGGTMGSIGGDFSTLSTNPAGLGRFKSTEFQISPNIIFGNSDGVYLGNTLSDQHINFNISSAGIAFARMLNQEKGWQSFSIGFGINRLNQYNEELFISGINTNSSLLDLHSTLATGNAPENLETLFPFDAGVSHLGGLLMVDSNNIYNGIFGDVAPNQAITISRQGGKYEGVLGVSANYSNKLYLGASLGIPFVQFTESVLIREEDTENVVPDFNFFDLTTDVRTTGYGVNLKLGVLGRPHQNVRLGAAFHSPSLIRFDDLYSTFLLSDFEAVLFEVESPTGNFRYNLVTPMKILANAGFLISKIGFISAEYEAINQGGSKLKFKSNDSAVKLEEESRNNQIAELYTWQHSARFGMEFKVDPVRVRLGFQYKSSALGNGEPAELVYSGGLGYRGKHFFLDGAYSFTSAQSSYVPYELNSINSGTADFEHKRSQITLTLGYKL